LGWTHALASTPAVGGCKPQPRANVLSVPLASQKLLPGKVFPLVWRMQKKNMLLPSHRHF